MDQTPDYNPDLKYDPNAPTMDQQMLAKYFSADAAGVTSYTVKGGDLELEIQADTGGRKQYWSLRKALEYEAYNGVPISLICEVSVLEGLLVEGQPGAGRHVIFDVHSFDIQIANHQSTSAAGLTVRNATLELTDSFKTTGAELAVGNNATMVIDEGGTLIIDDKCQLEVEYDAASTAPDSGTAAPDYGVGVLTVRNGGRIENRGIITVEGTEGKPIDPAASVEIPYGCRSIGAGAFRGCANLRQIAIPSSVTSIDVTAFDGCADLIVCGADGSAAHTFCQENTRLTFVVCPE